MTVEEIGSGRSPRAWRLGKRPFAMRWCYSSLNYGYAAGTATGDALGMSFVGRLPPHCRPWRPADVPKAEAQMQELRATPQRLQSVMLASPNPVKHYIAVLRRARSLRSLLHLPLPLSVPCPFA
jgi:hypothetical protein